MAHLLVDSLAGDYDPDDYEDDYAAAVQAVVEAKVSGGEVTEVPTAGDSQARSSTCSRRSSAAWTGPRPPRRGRREADPHGPCRAVRAAAQPGPAACQRIRPTKGSAPPAAPYSRAMPEGHHLHRLAAALDEAFAGTTPEVSSPGPVPGGAALLDGHPVVEAFAAGKHLFVEFAGRHTSMSTSGSSGSSTSRRSSRRTRCPGRGCGAGPAAQRGVCCRPAWGRPCARPRPLGTSSRVLGRLA